MMAMDAFGRLNDRDCALVLRTVGLLTGVCRWCGSELTYALGGASVCAACDGHA